MMIAGEEGSDIGGGVCVARIMREFARKGEEVRGARSVKEGTPRMRMTCDCVELVRRGGRERFQGSESVANGSNGSRGRKTWDDGRGGIK